MSPPKTPRVLVIDHDWLLRMSLADEFRMCGWSVLDVGSGEQALQLADSRIDVLFTAICLPGLINGWDVADTLRAVRADLPVLYAIAWGADRSRQVTGGVCFETPYDYTRVVGTSRNLLRR
jgi:CheY-like chemotaxis protein